MKLYTEAGRNASIFYYEETAGGLLWQGERCGQKRGKSAGKGIVNHAAGGMAGSAVKKASGGAKPGTGRTVRRKTLRRMRQSMKANEHAYEIGEWIITCLVRGNHYEIYKN